MTKNMNFDEPFYPLLHSISRKLRKANLTAAEWRFWAYLTENDPWGDKYKQLDPLDIMAECDISKPTYYRAKAKFQEMGLYDFQEDKVNFRNLAGISSLKKKTAPVSEQDEKIVSKMRQDEAPDSKVFENKFSKMTQNPEPSKILDDAFSKMRMESQKFNKESPKLAPSKGSEAPQTLQTYSDLIKTLSEDVRGSFEKFCKKKMDEVPFKIGSRLAWLKKYGAEYLEEFKETYSDAVEGRVIVPPKAEVTPPDILTLRKMYGPNWEEAARYYGYELDSHKGEYSAPAALAQSDIDEPILW